MNKSAQITEPLSLYLRDIQRHEILSPKEEGELMRRFRRKNDKEAGRRIILSHLRLVIKIAKGLGGGRPGQLADLIQEGNLGLVQALEKYDPSKGTKFSYYASFWIKAYIYKYLINNWSQVKIGTTQAQRKLFYNLGKVKKSLKEKGVRPTPRRIAAELHVTRAEVVEMEKRFQNRDRSLNAPLPSRSDGEQLDTISDDAADIEEVVARAQVDDLVRENADRFRGKLDPRQREIFDRRIYAGQPVTLQVLAERFDISRERVRQIETKILEKMRHFFVEEVPDYEEYAA
ncbi:MAG: RNA polymerase factor sigma-32 [Desulfobacterales bacterium]|jgi:RNA polymerase sigma-32 factor